MSTESSHWPADIATLLQRHMESGRFASETDVLRAALEYYDDIVGAEDDWEAIQEALYDLESGAAGLSIAELHSELDREIRQLP